MTSSARKPLKRQLAEEPVLALRVSNFMMSFEKNRSGLPLRTSGTFLTAATARKQALPVSVRNSGDIFPFSGNGLVMFLKYCYID